MKRTEEVELTVLCMIYDGERILLQNRIKEDWRGYTLPGGHVEKGESFVEATIREMKEETGLDIVNPILCGVKQFPIENGRYIVFLFKTNQFSGSVVSSEEGEMEWVERKDLMKFNLVDHFSDLLSVIDNDNLTELQYVIEEDMYKASIK